MKYKAHKIRRKSSPTKRILFLKDLSDQTQQKTKDRTDRLNDQEEESLKTNSNLEHKICFYAFSITATSLEALSFQQRLKQREIKQFSIVELHECARRR